MVLLQTGLELAPAGTAYPTTGVMGDGDSFSAGNQSATATLVSSTFAAALADGSYCARFDMGATSAATSRSWTFAATSDLAFRSYIYLDSGSTNGSIDHLILASGATVLARLRINGALNTNLVLGGVVQTTSVGTLSRDVLYRIEGAFHLDLTAGTMAINVYPGNSLTPIANVSLTASGLAYAAATTDTARIGAGASGVNSGFYTDSWAVDTAGTAIGPAGLAAPAGLTATAVSPTQIDLSWGAVSGATGYDIERDGTVIVSRQAGTTYSDTGRSPSTLYSYRVRAVA